MSIRVLAAIKPAGSEFISPHRGEINSDSLFRPAPWGGAGGWETLSRFHVKLTNRVQFVSEGHQNFTQFPLF